MRLLGLAWRGIEPTVSTTDRDSVNDTPYCIASDYRSLDGSGGVESNVESDTQPHC